MGCHTLFEAMKLPGSMRDEVEKLLTAIEQAPTATDCTRADDRADGFVLGVKPSGGLPQFDGSLCMVFADATEERRLELRS